MIPTPRARLLNRPLLIALCVPALFLAACEEADTDVQEPAVGEEYITERGGVLHPQPQFIPHHDNEHIPISGARPTKELEDVPGEITLLAEYLDDPANETVRALDVGISKSARAFRVESVGDSRLVMLGTSPYDGVKPRIFDHEERLVEYDLATGEHVRLDTAGGLPRDFVTAHDIAYRNEVLYVLNNGPHVARFDCGASPCMYDSTVKMPRSLRSITPVTRSLLAALGEAPKTQEGFDNNVPPSELYQDVVVVYDVEEREAAGREEGGEILAFGDAYHSEVHRFNTGFMHNARLAYSPDAGRYALTYPPFPYLYVYGEEGQLAASYRFDDDIEPAVEYLPDNKGRLKYNYLERDPKRSYFLITEIEGLALVVRESIEAASREEDDAAYNYDYYVVDLQDEEVYHVGTDAYVGQQAKMIYPTDAGLVLNEGGALSFIEK